jgi:glutamate racemase
VHVLITDSGVGGLSVCAYAERFVRTQGFEEPVRLTFANAAPENDYGYNSMPSRHVKLETFDRFLRNVTERYEPDMIYVACNTLSVLLPDTPYSRAAVIPVKGIVETGVDLLFRELEREPKAVAMIFATQGTIDSGAYPRLLEERGIASQRIIGQACPGLADTISEDREGVRTKAEIERWVATAIGKMPSRELPVVAALACTHYGYRKDVFEGALSDAGVSARVINPNERAVEDIFGTTAGTKLRKDNEVPIEFVTRYAIPEATVQALTWFLDDISPRTVAAMKNYVHVPDLF